MEINIKVTDNEVIVNGTRVEVEKEKNDKTLIEEVFEEREGLKGETS